MRTTTFLSFLYALALTLADYQCPNDQTSCNIICGKNPSNIQCESSLINASSVTTELTILCPDSTSCHNMTTICPVGNNTKCQVSCTDSLSCDATTIYSESTETFLNCISSDIHKEDICTNSVTIDLSGINTTAPLTASVLCALNTTNTDGTTVRVCDGITITTINATNGTIYSSATIGGPSLLTFECDGNGILCNHITTTAPYIATLNITVNGVLNDSVFINDHNNINTHIVLGDNALVSWSSFIATAIGQGSSVSISMANGSVSRSNAFIFNDYSTIKMVTAESTDFALFTQSNITITTEWVSQTVLVEGIVGDATNNLTAQQTNIFTLECTNNYTKCGNVGIIDVRHAFEARVTIGGGVTFGTYINASGVRGVDAIITALDGAILDGLSLDAASAGQITLNVYGETRGRNIINGSGAMGFNVNCYNPKSCSGELEFIVHPGYYTDIHCVGTGCDRMILNIPQPSTDELRISVYKEDCPCEEERDTLCITEWDIKCDTNKTSSVVNGECDGECCDGIVEQMQQTYSNKYECPIRANKSMYICQEGVECNIDCKNITQYGQSVSFECSSAGVIDASMAVSLSVLCSTEDAACSDLNIWCPDGRLCRVHCDGDCKGLNIVGNASRVLFECMDSACISLDVDNHRGNISIYMTGIKSTISASNISAHSVMIGGDSYTFEKNNITYYSRIIVDGDSKASFEVNQVVDNEGDVYTLSIHSNTNNISFAIVDNSLNFIKADYVEIWIQKNNSFSHKTVQMFDPKVVSVTNSDGFINNISLNATDANNFTLSCFGGCDDTVLPNRYILRNVDNVAFNVMNDAIDSIHTVVLNATNISSLQLVAHLNGAFRDILMDDIVKNMMVSCNTGGIVDNLRVLSPAMDVLKVRNDGGIINKLNIKPVNAIHKVSVDINGTLSNSSIDATKSKNLSVICSNVMDGFCSNVTLMIPVSDDAVSSLLCKNEGCQNMIFYTVNDMDDLDLSLTACKCSEAIKSSCVRGGNEWSIYCEENKNGEASVFAKNKCDGACCGDVVEDMKLKECDYSGGSKKKHHGVVVVVCSIMGGLVLIVLVGSVVYYCKKKKKVESEAVLLSRTETTVND